MKVAALLFAAAFAVLMAPPWRTVLEGRARAMLQPAALRRAGFEAEGIQYREHACWGHADGLVCDACYDVLVPPRYLAHAAVVCSWRTARCSYVLTAVDVERYGVDLNHCVVP